MKKSIMNMLLAFVGILSLTILVTGCEDLKFGNKFLDKPVTTDITIDTVFNSKKYAEQALNEVYHSLPDFLPMPGRLWWSVLETLTDLGDNVKPGGIRGYYSGDITASFSSDALPYRFDGVGSEEALAQGASYGIRKAWIFIENVDKVPDMTSEEKLRRKAEAKLIIAYQYSLMLRYYGGMPWIDHSYKPDDDMNMMRMTIEQMVNKICELADESATDLPWSVNAEDDGRMTAAAAKALKSRVLTFAASPLFNNTTPFLTGQASDLHYTWYGDYKKSRWQDALNAGLEFLSENEINSDFYALVNTGDPRKDYVSAYFDRYNKETIITSHRFTTYDMNGSSFIQIKYGVANATANYADMFEMKNGADFDWNNPTHKANPFFDASGNPVRDIRMYETLMIDGDKWQGRFMEIWKGGRESCEGSTVNAFQKNGYNGYGMRKFQRDKSTEVNGKFYSCPLLRLPEIYLNMAEAMNQLGLATQKDKFGRDAYDYVDLVRNRAGMPNLNRAKFPSGELLLAAILHERAVEFGFEEVRYFDLCRWKRSDLFQTKVRRLIIEKSGDTKTYTHTDLMVNERIWTENWNDRYFLLPFPQTEINKKYGLVQNPGWE